MTQDHPRVLIALPSAASNNGLKNRLIGLGFDVSQTIESDSAPPPEDWAGNDLIIMDASLAAAAPVEIWGRPRPPLVFLQKGTDDSAPPPPETTGPCACLPYDCDDRTLGSVLGLALAAGGRPPKPKPLAAGTTAALKLLFDRLGESVFQCGPDWKVREVNPAGEILAGRSAADLIGRSISDLVAAEDRDRFEEILRRVDGESVRAFAAGLRNPNREGARAIFNAVLLDMESGQSGAVVARRIETEPHELDEPADGLFHKAVDGSLAGIFIIRNLRLIYANPELARIHGYDSPEDMIGQEFFSLVHPEDREKIWQGDFRSDGGPIGPRHLELRGVRRDGTFFWVEVQAAMANFQGQPIIIGNLIDITGRKRAEKLLHLTQFSVETASISVLWVGANGRFLYANKTAYQNLGYTREELLRLHLWDIDLSSAAERWERDWQRFTAVGSAFFEVEHRAKNGRTITVDVSAHHVEFDGVEYAVAFVTDITLRKKAEAALREERNRFIFLLDNLPGMVYIHGPDRRIAFANSFFRERYGEPGGRTCHEVFYSRPTICSNCQSDDIAQVGRTQISEYIAPDGRIYQLYQFPFQEADGTPAILDLGIDITDRKEVEEKLQNALAESKVLLSEIHHRVKNNMQVISSLLQLQSHSIEDEKVRQALLDSQGRIQAMAGVHETIYGSERLSTINLANYFQRLTLQAVSLNHFQRSKITPIIKMDELELPLEKAVPLGLALNEILSNAIKYAFPEGRDGEIRLAARQSSDGGLEIRVGDNGVGLPTGFDWRNTKSLGLKIVVNLVEKQLAGSITLEQGQGLCYTIHLPLD